MNWYRSLYWRVAAGFIACLALLLVVQGVLFVWMMARAGAAVPNQPPERLAQTVAVDVAQALEREPSLDVAAYLRQEFARDTQPFLVLLLDGRTITIGAPIRESLVQEARARLNVLRNIDPARFARGGFGRGRRFTEGGAPPPGGAPEAGRPPERGPVDGDPRPADRSDPGARAPRIGPGVLAGPAFRGARQAPIVADGRLVLIEFRKESPWVPIREEHKLSVREARLELEAEGYRFERVIDVLPWQHILVFRP